MKHIKLQGVKQNNLKNIDVDIPLGSVTVICGPSGSGKSSLAFETLYAEGQRRYIEGMSNYAKQFLDKAPKPDVDHIENIPPAIAIEQKNSVKSSRSTVGTHTEIFDYLRLLYEKIGRTYCPKHKIPLKRHSVTAATESCLTHFSEQRGYILSPVFAEQRVLKGKKLLLALLKEGFLRIYLPPSSLNPSKRRKQRRKHSPLINVELGKTLDLQSPEIIKNGLPEESFYIVMDRLVFCREDQKRLGDSILQSYQASQKFNLNLNEGTHGGICHILSIEGQLLKFSPNLSCPICNHCPPPLSANFFSFNSPAGACPECKGFGNILELCPDKLIPNPTLSLKNGAISPFAMPSGREDQKNLLKFCKKEKIDVNTPWKELSKKTRDVIWNGNENFYGVCGLFEYLETKKYKMHIRVFLSRFKSPSVCNSCGGSRLKKNVHYVLVGNKNISQLSAMTIKELYGFFNDLKLSEKQKERSGEILRQIKSRLKFLLDVGVYYLTFNRETRTLSGGEFQRLNLAKQLGMELSQSLYVLDEPTIGLHPRDNERLIKVLHSLQELGNTLVIVEHDQDVIDSASHLIEMGPGSGINGGQITYSGKQKKLRPLQKKDNKSLFAKDANTDEKKEPLKLTGCTGHNLKGIDLQLPLKQFVCVTGVSGSGKSSLITKTLYPALAKKLYGQSPLNLDYKSLTNYRSLKDVVLIDQTSLGKNARSTPASYLKAFDNIRKIFCETPEARIQKYTPGTFSLNVDGGRCSLCRGLGFKEIDMVFMDNILIPCENCDGKQYQPQILEIKWKDKNIHEVLNMTASEALVFFDSSPKIRQTFLLLKEVGLDYLKIGQPLSSLSGGEAQRLKIAKELSQNKQRATLYVMDEPTTGLHYTEVQTLIRVIRELIADGASVVVIEHNHDMIEACDHVIDLGPEAGENGGEILVQGSPEQITLCPQSLTGKYLKTFKEKNYYV